MNRAEIKAEIDVRFTEVIRRSIPARLGYDAARGNGLSEEWRLKGAIINMHIAHQSMEATLNELRKERERGGQSKVATAIKKLKERQEEEATRREPKAKA